MLRDWALIVWRALGRWWLGGMVRARVAAVYAVLLSAVFFLLGGLHPRADYRALQDELETTREDLRRFAGRMAGQNDEIKDLRARQHLRQETEALLRAHIEGLTAQNIRAREESAFYRQIFGDRTSSGNVEIYTFEAAPGFAPGEWNLEAVLARVGKRKTSFKGGYYFDLVKSDGAGERLTRHPEEGVIPLQMVFYYEIQEALQLAPDEEIKNARLIVLNGKGKEVVSAESQKREDPSGNGEAAEAFGAPPSLPLFVAPADAGKN